MIYTVTFNPALDYVVGVPEFKCGIVNRTTYESISYGGKGINVSCILKRLGVPNTALGFVAGFTGREIVRQVNLEGIRTEFIELKEGLSRINIKLKSEQETEINAAGPIIEAADLEKLYKQLTHLKDGDIVVLAGSIPKTLPADIYEQIMRQLFHRDIQFVVDASKDLLTNVLIYRPFLIKPNHHELGEIFGDTIQDEEQIVYYAKELQNMGARNVLVSRGKDGALLVQEDGTSIAMGVVPGKVLNSVGAGDSMVAGFLAGWVTTGNYKEALRLGTAAGNATAFSLGLGTRELIDQVLTQLPE